MQLPQQAIVSGAVVEPNNIHSSNGEGV